MVAAGTLTLTCKKCTHQAHFTADDATEAAKKAVSRGWKMPQDDVFVCPRCVKKGRA